MSEEDEYKEAEGILAEFFQAATWGDESEILNFIHDGYDVNKAARFGGWDGDEPTTALQLAAKNGHVDCVQTLLNFGADISILNQHFTRAVLYASQNGDMDRLGMLAVAGFYKDIGIELYEELMAATHQRNYGRIDELLLSIVDGKPSECVQENELSFRIMTGYPVSCLETSIDAGVDVNGYNSRGFTPLIAAVMAGSVQWIDCLILKGAIVDKVEKMGMVTDIECCWVEDELTFTEELGHCDHLNSDEKSPLMFAVWTGKLDLVQSLVKQNLDFELYDSQKLTALGHATYAGQEEIVKELLHHGADVNFYNYEMEGSVLFHAVKTDNENIVSLLLSAGADLDLAKRHGRTPFFLAAQLDRANMMDLLFKTGKVDLNKMNEYGETPLMWAAINGSCDCIKFLVHSGADVNTLNRDEETALEIAAEKGWLECVKFLMESGGDKELVHSHAHQLIHSAARGTNQKMLEFCLKKCKNVDAYDSSGNTALFCAAEEGWLENIKILLRHGADINLRNTEGATAIIPCLAGGDFDCFMYLIQEGADLDIVTNSSETPVYLASGLDDTKFLETVLKHGGIKHINSVGKLDSHGVSPLIRAISKKNEECVEMLLSHGADINTCDNTGSTPLIHAVRAKMIHIVQRLLKGGADVNAMDEDEFTVIWDAFYSPECLELLLKDGAVLGEDGKLRSIHTEYGIEWGLQWNMKCLKLLFEFDVFEWDWYNYAEQGDQIHKIAFAAVCAGHSPYLFKSKEEKTTSLLQEAFLGNDYLTARYLFANFYLTMEDYRRLSSSQEFYQKVSDKEDVDPQAVAFLESVSSQPWRLETVCFLVISSSIKSSRQPGQTRSAIVDDLPLPEMFKSKLKFKDPVHEVCWKDWGNLLPTGEGNHHLLNLSKPQCLQERELVNCEDDCEFCLGLALQQE